MTSNYWVSTQCNHWLVTRAQIAIARAEDTLYAGSAEEHYALRIFFINCISLLAKRLFLRQRVTVTAIVFFHRFYSCAPGNSFSSTSPPLVIAACIYVASKVEETPIHIRNVAHESARLWGEMGYKDYPSDSATLAEMEFYLLEDLQFHLVVYHPFRSLVAIYSAAGKGAPVRPNFKQSAATSWNGLLGSSLAQVLGTTNNATSSSAGASPLATPVGAGDLGVAPSPMEPDLAYGSPGAGLSGRKADENAASISGELHKVRQLDKQTQARVMQEMVDERNRMFLYAGDDDMPLPRLEELDEQVLQMAWFVLNDSYRTDLLLLHPPHIIAVAAIFLGLVLHEGTREKMLRSKKWMDDSRERYYQSQHDFVGSADSHIPPPTEKKNETKASQTPTTPHEISSSAPSPTKPTAAHTPSPGAANLPSTQAAPSPSNGTNITQSQTTQKPALRGLASLPPRPAHLPAKPMVAPGQSWQISTPQQQQQQQQQAQGARPSLQAHASGTSSTASPANGNVPSPQANADTRAAADGAASAQASQGNAEAKSAPRPVSTAKPHLPTPPPDALTFLAALNVDLDAVAEVVQEMLSLYDFWHKVGSRAMPAAESTPEATQAGNSTSSPHSQSAAAAAANSGSAHARSDDADGPSSAATTVDSNLSASALAARPRKDEDAFKNSGTTPSGASMGTPAAAQQSNTDDIYIGNAPNMLHRLSEMQKRRYADLHELPDSIFLR